MDDTLSISVGGSDDHIGMSRDTSNGISYFNWFKNPFFFGQFTSDNFADVLTRDNSANSDFIPWYMSKGTGSGFSNSGQIESDFGQQDTALYLQGDFNGDGCDDFARDYCTDNCNPTDDDFSDGDDYGDGNSADDSRSWYVQEGECDSNGGFGYTSEWVDDFGDTEDHDQFRSGDFNGDGCEDLLLIRNTGSRTCDLDDDLGDAKPCKAKLQIALANGSCDGFSISSGFKIDTASGEMTLSDRNAPVSAPWVVGDFDTTSDSAGCDDIAYGVLDQQNPETLQWEVLSAVDSDLSGTCDKFDGDSNGRGSVWLSDWGNVGWRFFFAADVGAPSGYSGDDLVRVWVKSADRAASWGVAYSNGANAFVSTHTPVYDIYITGGEDRWTGKVFGVADFDGQNGPDFVTLNGTATTGAVDYVVAYRDAGTGVWSEASHVHGGQLPTSQAAWNAPTDADSTAYNNAGDDMKDPWWHQSRDLWNCLACYNQDTNPSETCDGIWCTEE